MPAGGGEKMAGWMEPMGEASGCGVSQMPFTFNLPSTTQLETCRTTSARAAGLDQASAHKSRTGAYFSHLAMRSTTCSSTARWKWVRFGTTWTSALLASLNTSA